MAGTISILFALYVILLYGANKITGNATYALIDDHGVVVGSLDVRVPNDFWPFSMSGAFPVYHSYSEGACTFRHGSRYMQDVLMAEDFWPPLRDPWIRTARYLSIETLNGEYVKAVFGDIDPQIFVLRRTVPSSPVP